MARRHGANGAKSANTTPWRDSFRILDDDDDDWAAMTERPCW